MPFFKPFKGIRPRTELVESFVTSNIDHQTHEDLCGKVMNDSYLKMIRPAICSKAKDENRNLNRVRQNLEELLTERKLIKENDSVFYLCSQIVNGKTIYRGLLGLTSVEDFNNGKIKKHEATLTKRKEKMAQFLEKVELQAEPVLLTYPTSPKLEVMMDLEEKNIPVLNFTDKKGVRHKVWKIEDRLKLKQFKGVIENMDSLYIADGHHRIGSVALNAKNHDEKGKGLTGREGYNYVYSYVISNQSIKIHDYNRVIKDLNGLSKDEFLKSLETYFLIHKKEKTPYYPTQRHHIGMYLDGEYYSLHVRHDLRKKESGVESLDHYFLEKNVINKILGIENSKFSDKLDYVNGNSTMEGMKAIIAKVDSGEYTVGFVIHPITYHELVEVSDLGQKMPPKCTYIEPKLLTAMIMYDMK